VAVDVSRHLESMDLSESALHSFIIKLWLEADSSKGEPAVWRGYITHVPSGDRRYLKSLSDITVFVREYLNDAQVAFPSKSRARQWLRCFVDKTTKSG
jgi:hypothetical protein